jgi:hypothetical protein
MNLNCDLQESELAALLAETMDDGDHIVWADTYGDVFISTLAEDQDPVSFQDLHPTMRLRFESLMADSGHVGPEATNDPHWLGEFLQALERGWKEAEHLPSGGVQCVAWDAAIAPDPEFTAPRRGVSVG